jgi:glycosyltransferase involved in cell wall biosynthesis
MTTGTMTALTIAIEAQIQTGLEGGIEQYLIGLINGLSRLDRADERYVVVQSQRPPNWHVASGTDDYLRFLAMPASPIGAAERVKRWLGPLRKPLGSAGRWVQRRGGPPAVREPRVRESDGFWEALGADALHITYPLHFFRSSVPTVFTLCDLQHRHFPEFFSDGHLRWRETVYPAAFQHARAIVTISGFVKQDLTRQYGVSPDKIFVVPLASPAEAYAPRDPHRSPRVLKKLGLPSRYVLYPALTYQHKNHIRLLEAIALVRDRLGVRINLVCTGSRRLHWPSIERRLHELALGKQVHFLGFVSTEDFRAVFGGAEHLIFPSLFEGAGIPLLDALFEDVAVTCSDIPAFREYGGDAVSYFDPQSVESIAAALLRMRDPALRHDLRSRGRVRRELFAWSKTAAVYRAIYRWTAAGTVSDRDRRLLTSALAASSITEAA